MVDIAVPGDIHPEVAELNDVYLYTVDDLKEVIEENLKSRQDAAKQAEEIIDVQADHFMDWVHSLDAVPAICAYRDHVHALGAAELEKASRRLANGEAPQQVLETLTHNLINKLAHKPSVNLRQAGKEDQACLLETVRLLFSLDETR
jgi:glutamyl-tRNA reductase